jgi:hypothetical protein
MKQLDEKIALMRAAVVAWTARSVRVKVGPTEVGGEKSIGKR